MIYFFVANNVLDYDDNNCIDKADLDLADFLIGTLVDVCDCVPKSMQNIYHNPAMLAASAMLLPNLLHVLFLAKKYITYFIAMLNKISAGYLQFIFAIEDYSSTDNMTEDFLKEVCIAIDVLSLILNIAIGLIAILDYFTSPYLLALGGNVCQSTHATFGVVYKPVLVSFFRSSCCSL